MAEPVAAASPSDSGLHPSGSLVMAAALAAVAGYLDAHLFLHVGQVFVANMSGNVVLAGMAAGKRDGAGVAGPLVAIVAFIGGMALATFVHNRFRRDGRPLRPDLLVGLELVAFAVLIAFAIGFPDTTDGTATPRAYPILGAGGFAMGLQTAVLRRVGSVPVSTTYESGVVARLGEASVLAADGSRGRDERAARGHIIWILSALVLAYAAGAAVASALGESVGLLLIPVAVLVVVGVVLWRARDGSSGP
jgi:uncharacterized membrane protein YoaK (UPF0700 family)